MPNGPYMPSRTRPSIRVDAYPLSVDALTLLQAAHAVLGAEYPVSWYAGYFKVAARSAVLTVETYSRDDRVYLSVGSRLYERPSELLAAIRLDDARRT